MLPEIRPAPTDADLLARCRLRYRQDYLLDLLRARDEEAFYRDFYAPLWPNGPTAGQVNLGLEPAWAGHVEAMITELEG